MVGTMRSLRTTPAYAATLVLTCLLTLAQGILTIPLLAQDNCVCATCGRPCKDIPTLGHKDGYPCAPRKQGTTGHSSGASISVPSSNDRAIQNALMQRFLQGLLNPPAQAPGKSPEEAKREREAREREIGERLARWNAERDAYAGQMKGRPAATALTTPKGILQDELHPLSGVVHRPGKKAWEHLNASGWLSGMALQAAKSDDLVEASYLSEQAFQAAVGAPLSVAVPPAPTPPEAWSGSPEEVKAHKEFVDALNVQIKKVIEATKTEQEATKARTEAEAAKASTEKTLKEVQSRPSASPEDPDLIAAQKALALSEEHLKDARLSEEKAKKSREQEEESLKTIGSTNESKPSSSPRVDPSTREN